MAALNFPAELCKPELSGDEIVRLLESKLRGIQNLQPDQPLVSFKDAIKAVKQKLATRIKADQSLDQRNTIANTYSHVAGVIPNAHVPPRQAAADNEGYMERQERFFNSECEVLLSLLDSVLLSLLDSYEVINIERVTDLQEDELCNYLDRATEAMLQRNEVEGDMTDVTEENEKIRKMYDQCLQTAATCKALLEAENHDGKCKKRVQMIASLGALAVALKKRISGTECTEDAII